MGRFVSHNDTMTQRFCFFENQFFVPSCRCVKGLNDFVLLPNAPYLMPKPLSIGFQFFGKNNALQECPFSDNFVRE